ncbi:hypothetical protein GCM10007938_40170 [Vibrio zhanjiangensis]|uniref:Uncharacterized protein n=1 Tax=Vibrio zhanjiangensis TaxID=1046128 RepID=A0ABQ6F4P5_9VIBR|nr:hypothetical protein [Vibrio zhanjiangensis]GLT20234.1 hypothetical protein GCM10007938_40170 [Vibrio zhanjiangensis]
MSQVAIKVAVLPHQGNIFRTRRRLEKAHPARYRKVVVRGDYVCLYTSDVPAVAISEGWVEWLISQSRSLESVALFIEDAEKLLLVMVEQGVVSDICYLPREEWVSVTAIQTLWIGESAPVGFEGDVFDDVIVTGPSLSRVTRFPLIGAGLGLMCIGTWLAWSQMSSEPTPPTTAVQTDPFEHYRQRMAQGVSAHQTLSALSTLWSLAHSLPSGWHAEKIVGEGHTVTLQFIRTPAGFMQGMTLWAAQYSEWARYLSFDMQGGKIQLTLTPDLTPWVHQTVTPSQSQAWLSDWLILAGVSAASTQKSDDSASITLDIDTLSPSQWVVIAQLSQALPALVERFSFSMGEAGALSGPLTITLYGESL